MKKVLLIHVIAIAVQAGLAQSISDVRQEWTKSWSNLDIPLLQLDYQTFINAHLESRTLKDQSKFFASIERRLKELNTNLMGPVDRLDKRILMYETALNLQRLTLIDQTKENFRGGGIYDEQNGKAWYAYLVQHWTSTSISPQEVSRYGQEEVKRIQAAMQQLKEQHDIQRTHTNEPSVVEAAFGDYEAFLEKRVWQVIPEWTTPNLQVRRGTNSNLSQVPGYYAGDVLSYNLFDDPFDLSQIDWLYLHEGIPGHHFQLNSEQRADIPRYRTNMNYSGFREGWAAYVEELAQEQNWYMGPERRLSQMEWDLIRSIRLVIDVGINYEGWSDLKAMEVWKSVIPDADHIGRREIARMRRWPAQVLTYKIGAKIILETRQEALGGESYNKALHCFHSRLLSKGSIPMALVPELFKNSPDNQKGY